jgi:hypothetical protein
MMATPNRFFLNRLEMLNYLNELKTIEEINKSLYISSGCISQKITNIIKDEFSPKYLVPEITKCISSSKTGVVLFWNAKRIILTSPPFPILMDHFTQGCYVDPLRNILERDHKIALILIRLGTYAIGLSKGLTLVESKVGKGLIHRRHKKGGSSQQRFRRHREKQIESFLNRVCEHINCIIKPENHLFDYLIYGGAQTTILQLKKHCPVLKKFDQNTLPPLLNIPNPNKIVIEGMLKRIWLSHITEWNISTT